MVTGLNMKPFTPILIGSAAWTAPQPEAAKDKAAQKPVQGERLGIENMIDPRCLVSCLNGARGDLRQCRISQSQRLLMLCQGDIGDAQHFLELIRGHLQRSWTL